MVKTASSNKENSQQRSSKATKPKLASKPLRAQPSTSNGTKDAETAALVASLRGEIFFNLINAYDSFFCSAEIDQLKKAQAAKPVEKKMEEIPRPTKMTSLQIAMGLADDKKLYSFCRVSSFFFPFLTIWLTFYIVSCSRCRGTFRTVISWRLAKSRRCTHSESR